MAFDASRAARALWLTSLLAACGGSEAASSATRAPAVVEGTCVIDGAVDSAPSLSCKADFEALASVPIDSNIPGARSVKVVLDQLTGDALHFQNSQKYQIHYQFVSAHLSGGAHKPTPVLLPMLDLSVREVVDAEQLVDESVGTLRDAIERSVRAFGGKAAQYGVLATTRDLPVRKACAIPVFFYDQFMRDNGFYARVAALLADPAFKNDPAVREAKLGELQDDMRVARVDDAFQALLKQKLAVDYGGLTMRFRSSTNSEDLDGFPCAGCYESHTGDPSDWEDVLDAIRKTWATVWLFRTFEERSYYGIDHTSVGMALLVHLRHGRRVQVRRRGDARRPRAVHQAGTASPGPRPGRRERLTGRLSNTYPNED